MNQPACQTLIKQIADKPQNNKEYTSQMVNQTPCPCAFPIHGKSIFSEEGIPVCESVDVENFPFLDHCQILETEKLSPLLLMLIFFPSSTTSPTPSFDENFPFSPTLSFTKFLLLGHSYTCKSESATTYWYDPME